MRSRPDGKPGLPRGFWRGYLIAAAFSLPVWALIGLLIYWITHP